MRIGSLFAGIGGLELGLEWAGVGRTVWQVESDRHCLHWLAQHWPDVRRFGDVRYIGAHNLPFVDVLCGGFPCQPHSVAGSRKAHNDDRDLWPEFRRIICGLRPSYVVAENVPGLLTSDDGRFFNRILSDLAAAGYDAEWDVLSAGDVGAPQGRDRVFIIAWLGDPTDRGRLRRPELATLRPIRTDEGLGHALGERGCGGRERWDAGDAHASSEMVCGWQDAVPVRGCDGTFRLIPADAAARGPESPLWPVAAGVPGRVARLRAIGNAVVPACAEVVGRRLLEIAAELHCHNSPPGDPA